MSTLLGKENSEEDPVELVDKEQELSRFLTEEKTKESPETQISKGFSRSLKKEKRTTPTEISKSNEGSTKDDEKKDKVEVFEELGILTTEITKHKVNDLLSDKEYLKRNTSVEEVSREASRIETEKIVKDLLTDEEFLSREPIESTLEEVSGSDNEKQIKEILSDDKYLKEETVLTNLISDVVSSRFHMSEETIPDIEKYINTSRQYHEISLLNKRRRHFVESVVIITIGVGLIPFGVGLSNVINLGTTLNSITELLIIIVGISFIATGVLGMNKVGNYD